MSVDCTSRDRIVGYCYGSPVFERLPLLLGESAYRFRHLSLTHFRRAVAAGAAAVYVNMRSVLLRDGCACYLCGEVITEGMGRGPWRLQFDHVIPISRGGEHSPANVRPVHAACHYLKNASER